MIQISVLSSCKCPTSVGSTGSSVTRFSNNFILLQGRQSYFLPVPSDNVKCYEYSPIILDMGGPDVPDRQHLHDEGLAFISANICVIILSKNSN